MLKWLIAVIALIIFIALYQQDFILISGDYSCITNAENFSVSFIHSVELSKEIDFFYVNGTSIYLRKTLVKSAGWGLPSTEPLSITKYKGEEWFEYKIQRCVGVLRISTNPINQYTLEIGEKSINLNKFGNYVEVKVIRLNPIIALFQRWC